MKCHFCPSENIAYVYGVDDWDSEDMVYKEKEVGVCGFCYRILREMLKYHIRDIKHILKE